MSGEASERSNISTESSVDEEGEKEQFRQSGMRQRTPEPKGAVCRNEVVREELEFEM